MGSVHQVSTVLSSTDYREHFKCRTTAYRNDYKVDPGLYAVGDPDRNSEVLVSANYKYSFDLLRRELKGLDAWILVLDTKGINVWCAAGKGTFGTAELVKRISEAQLDKVVAHRQVIVPQLGAPGVSAFKVKQTAGFRVLYGPVRAKDIPAYIKSGYKATREMRRVNFSVYDRLVLTPMEINPAMKKFPLYAALVLVVFGLSPSGIMFKDAFIGGFPFLLLGLVSLFSGALLTPVLLPYVPFRSFAVKGWIIGLLSVLLLLRFVPLLNQQSVLLLIVTYLFFPQASSYIALQFTGSTTFTGMSGVKRELRIAIPTYIVSCAVSLVLLMMYKFIRWGVI
ncbi:MAG: mercury methylation corrinoid protein HgcA [Dissulfurispiraceae bacterium]